MNESAINIEQSFFFYDEDRSERNKTMEDLEKSHKKITDLIDKAKQKMTKSDRSKIKKASKKIIDSMKIKESEENK